MNRCCRSTWFSAALLLPMVIALMTAWCFVQPAEAASLCKKEIPQITFKNLSPPYTEYDYFQYRKYFPFAYTASAFSAINAWWLAEASMLVYADEAYVTQGFTQAGMTRIQFFNQHSTQCFVASNEWFAIVAFRGSEIWKRDKRFDPRRMMADLKTDIDIRRSEWDQGGRVHHGFKAALDEVWDELRPAIENLEARGLKIWLTGHSLGGALATLAADRLGTVQGLYTFGSPKVGDKAFKAGFQISAFRMVYGNDIVPSLPPEGPFQHVGELKWLGPKDSRENVEADCSGALDLSGNARKETNFTSSLFIPSFIRDHVPLLYSIAFWNALIESMETTRCPFGSNCPQAYTHQ